MRCGRFRMLRRFSNASSAGEAVAEVMAQRRAALDAYQTGAIGKLPGATEPSEVTAKIGQILGNPTPWRK